ncbi:MAG: diguanylate cyclase [Algicola sp.]|nr:diguanylate cyclase [Algicola sp.]
MDTLNKDVTAKPVSLATILWVIIAGSLTIHMVVMIIGHTILADWRWTGLAVHTSLEISGAIIALFVAMFLLRYERYGQGTHFNVHIAAALICMGVLDGFHAIVEVGNTFVWLHSIATFSGGLLFVLVFIPKQWYTFSAISWPLFVLGGSLVLGLMSFAYPEVIPTMIVNKQFTFWAVLLNVVGGIALFISAIKLIWSYQRYNNIDDLLFCLHCSLFGAAAIMFQQSSLWDTSWWGWHILRLLAYAIALWFVINGEAKIMNELEQHRFHLTELVAKQTQTIAQSEAQLIDAQRVAHLGSWQRNIASGKAVWSDELYRICGLTPGLDAPTQDTLINILHPDDKDEFLAQYQRALIEGQTPEREYRIVRPNGEIRWLQISGMISYDELGNPLNVLGTALDITDHKIKEAQIEHLANHDALTDLPALRLCRERMGNELARAKRNGTLFAVMFVDLDGFKLINDNLGHDVGDDLLIKVAQRLTRCLRDIDTVARIGGDEFLVLQTDVKNESSVSIVAKKLIETISTSYVIGQHTIEIGASIGISLYPANGDTISTLMKQADQTMYRVKKSGKNNFDFS